MNQFMKVCIGMHVLIAFTLFLDKFWPQAFFEGQTL